MTSTTRRLAAVTLAALIVTGCSRPDTPKSTSSTPAPSTSTSQSPTTGPAGSITVFAAASLKEVFTKLAKSFEAAHPGTTITFSFGASSTLATQIDAGAPADVFAAASTTTMKEVVTAGFASSPVDFAKNTMEIATPPANPAGITTLADLAKAGIKVAICQAAVPCGSTAAKVFKNAGLSITPATLEPDVKSVLTKVELGEADAGVVYVTDVKAAGSKVHGVVIPKADNATTTYPIAALTKSGNPALATAFVDYLLSSDGLAALAAAGFAAP